ncbi:hypothetical protein BH10PSE10_BH10PSE10_10700 [soil metagenome]
MMMKKTPVFPAILYFPGGHTGSGEHNVAIENGGDEEKRRQ